MPWREHLRGWGRHSVVARRLAGDRRLRESEPLAASVPDTGGVYFVPAFVAWVPPLDMYARGTILGLTRGTTRAHLVRAALEAIAYQSREVLGAALADAGLTLEELRVDGGATANNLLMQFQATY